MLGSVTTQMGDCRWAGKQSQYIANQLTLMASGCARRCFMPVMSYHNPSQAPRSAVMSAAVTLQEVTVEVPGEMRRDVGSDLVFPLTPRSTQPSIPPGWVHRRSGRGSLLQTVGQKISIGWQATGWIPSAADWGSGMTACCNMGLVVRQHRQQHNVLWYHWLTPISCHFLDWTWVP